MITKVEIRTWMDNNIDDHTFRGEVNMTTLGEECAAYFNVQTDLGDSEIEEFIFEVASEYVIK